MGLVEKPQHHQMEGCLQVESEDKRWIIAGIALRSPLKPILVGKKWNNKDHDQEEADDDNEYSTTPTSEESRIPWKNTCPPAPKKRKASQRFHLNGVMEFFNPTDLETLFIRRVEV